MHRRREADLQKRKIRGIIFRNSFRDAAGGETISRITRLDVLSMVHEPVMICDVPDVEKGEVLVDLRGRGSMQS